MVFFGGGVTQGHLKLTVLRPCPEHPAWVLSARLVHRPRVSLHHRRTHTSLSASQGPRARCQQPAGPQGTGPLFSRGSHTAVPHNADRHLNSSVNSSVAEESDLHPNGVPLIEISGMKSGTCEVTDHLYQVHLLNSKVRQQPLTATPSRGSRGTQAPVPQAADHPQLPRQAVPGPAR